MRADRVRRDPVGSDLAGEIGAAQTASGQDGTGEHRRRAWRSLRLTGHAGCSCNRERPSDERLDRPRAASSRCRPCVPPASPHCQLQHIRAAPCAALRPTAHPRRARALRGASHHARDRTRLHAGALQTCVRTRRRDRRARLATTQDRRHVPVARRQASRARRAACGDHPAGGRFHDSACGGSIREADRRHSSLRCMSGE
jgi:hypothetical protein